MRCMWSTTREAALVLSTDASSASTDEAALPATNRKSETEGRGQGAAWQQRCERNNWSPGQEGRGNQDHIEKDPQGDTKQEGTRASEGERVPPARKLCASTH
eukprot:703308-Pleurochrysis_carterae.AAC.1